MKAPRRQPTGKPKPDAFRWLKALRICEELKNQAGALRLGMELFDLYNPVDGFAYPSRAYLAKALGSHESAISDWTTKLRDAGCIWTQKQSEMPADMRKGSDPRGLSYFLDIAWADSVLAIHSVSEGLSGQQPPMRKVVRSTTELVARSTTEVGSEVHYTDNLSGQPRDNREKIRSDRSEHSVYESRSLEIAYDPPLDMAEGIHWLRYQGLEEAEVRKALPLLMEGKLFKSHIDHMKMMRRAA